MEAKTHPKLVQERVGHSSIALTMDVYGKIAGKMTLGKEEEAKLNTLATTALPAQPPDQPPPGDTPQSIRKLRLHGRKLVHALRDGGPKQTSPDKQ